LSSTITTNEISIDTKNEKRHYVIGKCPDNRTASFEIRYADKWIKEDGRHLHKILRKYNLDPPLPEHGNKEKMGLALNSLRAKSKSLLSRKERNQSLVFMPDPDVEDFTIDQGDKDLKDVDQKKSVIEYIYKNLGAKYVRILKNQEPIKLVYSDKPFCVYETFSTRTLNNLRKKGIDINQLKKTDINRYYNSFTRCYSQATMNYEGKAVCQNHYRDLKFGSEISEDFNDMP
jgi:hypothetical protein